MENERNMSTLEFESAIKNFSKISVEVESLIDLGNVDAFRILNKSIENRKEAIANEASRRLDSIDMEQKQKKTKEFSDTQNTLEKLILQEVELEFDKGVKEQKVMFRGDSNNYESTDANIVKVDKEEDGESTESESSAEESAEDENTESSESCESSESSESTGKEEENTEVDESSDDETSNKDSTEDESSENEDTTGDENTEDEISVGKVDDSTTK